MDNSLTEASIFLVTSLIRLCKSFSWSANTFAASRFMTACELFSTYAVARHLTGALPLFAPKQMTDGKAEVQRFDASYRDTIKEVNEQYGRLRSRLIAAMEALGTAAATATPAVYMSVVSPLTDPVTGL